MEELLESSRPCTAHGRLADYIPELLKADPGALGVFVMRTDGTMARAGDCRRCFTIQSVVKPILLLLALMDNGVEAVRAKVGVETTGKPFDAINMLSGGEQILDSAHLNPMVNMGAILLCTMIKGDTDEEKFQRLLDLTRLLTDDFTIAVNVAVYRALQRASPSTIFYKKGGPVSARFHPYLCGRIAAEWLISIKNTRICPKCGCQEISCVPGGGRDGNRIHVGIISIVAVERYVCTACGFSEEWIDTVDLGEVKNAFGTLPKEKI